MTASAGVAITAGAPTVPLGRKVGSMNLVDGHGDGRTESSSNFQSELQNHCLPGNAPNTVPFSPHKQTSKSDSADKKVEKKELETAVATDSGPPPPVAQSLPAPPLALALTPTSDPQAPETTEDDPEADTKDRGTAPAPTPDQSVSKASRGDLRTLPITLVLPELPKEPPALIAAPTLFTPVASTRAATANVASFVEELPHFSGNTVEDSPSKPALKLGDLAFAAHLSPSQGDAKVASTPAATPRVSVMTALTPRGSSQPPVPQKYLPGGSVTEEADPQTGDAPQVAPLEQVYRATAAIPPVNSAPETAPLSKTSSSESPAPAAAQALQETMPEPAKSSAASSHDFQVHIPDNQGGTMAVRFVENGGDVRITVRTPDNNLAQTLRGQLNQLTQQLSTGGIQTELWQPGSDRNFSKGSQEESQNSGQGPGSGRKEQGQQQESNQNRPRWLEEMELSGGSVK